MKPRLAADTAAAPVARIARGLRWLVLGLVIAVAALFVTWRALAALDFAYPLFYDALAIDATIERHAPGNEARPGFERTTRAERERLFGALVEAVRDGGRGLERLVYRGPEGRPIGRLLTAAEVQHLSDVAALVTRFERLGWLSIAVCTGLLLASCLRRDRMPPLRCFALGAGAVLVLIGALLIAFGPVTVFYWLHEQIFPPDHPWFFWYEESLMSTMMQAPNLFGAIAALWIPLATALAAATWYVVSRNLNDRAEKAGTMDEHG